MAKAAVGRKRATNEQRHEYATEAKTLIDGGSTKQDAFSQVAEASGGFSLASVRNWYNEFYADESGRQSRTPKRVRRSPGRPAVAIDRGSDSAVEASILARYRSLDGDRATYEAQIADLQARIDAIEPTRAKLIAAAEVLGIVLPQDKEPESAQAAGEA